MDAKQDDDEDKTRTAAGREFQAAARPLTVKHDQVVNCL